MPKITVIDDIFNRPSLVEQSKDDNLQSKQMSTEQQTIVTNKMSETNKMTESKKRSYQFGVIGSGQAGSRIAECFYSAGYPAIVFNTALQDLEGIKIKEEQKFHLNYGFGGAAKELEIGRAAAEEYRELIENAIKINLNETEILILCLSLGGGSGAGSCETMVDIMASFGKPIIVITVLPGSGEDAKTKENALETLAKLSQKAENKEIHNLILIDNAKLETQLSHLSQFDFFPEANKAIVSPIDALNFFSKKSSSVKGIDSTEFGKLLVDGGGLSVYGKTTIEGLGDESSIANAIAQNLDAGLLASGFDLRQTKYAALAVVANQASWKEIPAMAITYAENQLSEVCEVPDAIFKGSYVHDLPDGMIEIYFFFSGLALPSDRIDELKKEAEEQKEKLRQKEVNRNVSLKLGAGKENPVSKAQQMQKQISAKKSAFGSLLSAGVNKKKF